MRITENSSYRNLLNDIQRIADRMQTAQNQVSSGKKLTQPSDNPAAAADVVRIDAERASNAQYIDNAASGQSRLQAADTTLNGFMQVIDRVRSLALLTGSSASAGASSAVEVAGLRDQVLSYANTVYDGQYIFAGSNTDSAAYVKASDGTITYSGNSNEMKLQVGKSATLQTQIPGNQIFSGSVDVFSTMTDLIAAMNSGDQGAIHTQVGKLEDLSRSVSVAQSKVGGLMNVATSAQSDLQSADLTQVAHLSRLQDADLATALSNLSQSQTALQAATAAGARISNISLLDYLK